MEQLTILVGILNCVVEWILLMAVDRFSGLPTPGWKKVAASVATGAHGAVCLLPGAGFLADPAWRWGLLLMLGLMLYGSYPKMLPRLAVMLLLNFGVEGFQQLTDQTQLLAFALAGILIAMLCVFCFHDSQGNRYVSVVLYLGQRRMELTALVDTGNTLRDPITGEGVLIVSHKVATALTGLTRQQLASPLETMEAGILPGLRLIPYHSIGCDNGMMLAMRFDKAMIGGKERDLLVAFAPAGLGKEGTFQALAGGIL